jgi:hypothetical protein
MFDCAKMFGSKIVMFFVFSSFVTIFLKKTIAFMLHSKFINNFRLNIVFSLFIFEDINDNILCVVKNFKKV